MQMRAGVNLATISGSVYSFHPGFYVGIQKDLPLSRERLTFQPGIYYSLQTTQSDVLRLTFHHVQVPAMFNLKFRKNGGIVFGPQLGMLLHATSKQLNGDDKIPVTPRFNTIALLLGGGPYVNINEQIKLELRINIDALNVDRSTTGENMISLQGGLVWLLSKPDAE
jgi:hypothetical protein